MLAGDPLGLIKAFPDALLLFSRDTRSLVMNRYTGYSTLYPQLHGHRLISGRIDEGIGQVAADDLGDALCIGQDGHDTLWRRALQHDGAPWSCPLLCGHGFSEQRVQIPAGQVQLEGIGLDTCIIEQVLYDALLKTGTLAGRR